MGRRLWLVWFVQRRMPLARPDPVAAAAAQDLVPVQTGDPARVEVALGHEPSRAPASSDALVGPRPATHGVS